MYRLLIAVVINISLVIPAFSAEAPDTTAAEGFRMTGMQQDKLAKETEPMKFKGMRRDTATRVLKETSSKNK